MGRFLSAAAGVAAALAVLALGLLAGAESAEADGTHRTAGFGAAASASAAGEIALGDGMELFGRPSQLSLFWTTDSTEQVIQSYASAWRAAGLEPEVRDLGRASTVFSVEKSTGLMRSVSVFEAGEERLVVPGLSDVRGTPDFSARRAPVPVPENARGYFAQTTDDITAISYSANYLVPLAPRRAVDFYRVELGKLGYEESPGFAPQGSASGAQFERGPETVMVVAMPTEDGAKNTAFVVVNHQRAVEMGAQ